MRYISLSLYIIYAFFMSACNTDQLLESQRISEENITQPIQDITKIDILVIYDHKVKQTYRDLTTRIYHLFAVTNNIYKASNIYLKISPKAILSYDIKSYPGLREAATSEDINALREQYRADMVLLYQLNPDGEQTGICGTAYSARSYDTKAHFEDAMYAQVAINCSSDTTAHELGHNMGLVHSHKQNRDQSKPFSHGLGHGVDFTFATVMAYAYHFNTTHTILKFSSPNYECVPGYPCGIPIGITGEADAASVIKTVAPKIANIY